MPPVGKSGPWTNCINSSPVAFGFLIKYITPSHNSPRLCGGMFVAMPTAIPMLPFNSRFGSLDGSTRGSLVEPFVGGKNVAFFFLKDKPSFLGGGGGFFVGNPKQTLAPFAEEM